MVEYPEHSGHIDYEVDYASEDEGLYSREVFGFFICREDGALEDSFGV